MVRTPVGGRFATVCVAARFVTPPGTEGATIPIEQPTTNASPAPDQAQIKDATTVWSRLAVPKGH
jgi:hypothetical protein